MVRQQATSTATWRKTRAKVIANALNEEQYTCPYCGIHMDYEYSHRPNSAEVDHIDAYSKHGDTGRYQVICKRCNQSKGNRAAPKAHIIASNKPLKVSRLR